MLGAKSALWFHAYLSCIFNNYKFSELNIFFTTNSNYFSVIVSVRSGKRYV
jgi:hypothetical protein